MEANSLGGQVRGWGTGRGGRRQSGSAAGRQQPGSLSALDLATWKWPRVLVFCSITAFRR